MWKVKFGFDGSNILYGKVSKLFNLKIKGYNLGSYEKNNSLYVNSAGLLVGSEENRNKAIKFLKRDKHILKCEIKNNFVTLLIREDSSFKPFYSPAFIYTSPIIIKNGIYLFNLASWSREDIERLLKRAEKFAGYALYSLKQEKIDNIAITGIEPGLTEKQKEAYDLAVEKGYYEFPKKITLKKLADLMKLSYSTYQQHLSYAEKKVHAFLAGKINTD